VQRFCPDCHINRTLNHLKSSYTFRMSRDSSVDIALGYGLDDRSSRVRLPAGAGNFSLLHRVQTGSGAHPASYPVGTRGSFPGVKWPGREVEDSPPSSAEVKNAWSYTSTPLYAFMAWWLVEHRDNVTFTLPSSFRDSHNTLTVGIVTGPWICM
jgi:hypothetical protein